MAGAARGTESVLSDRHCGMSTEAQKHGTRGAEGDAERAGTWPGVRLEETQEFVGIMRVSVEDAPHQSDWIAQAIARSLRPSRAARSNTCRFLRTPGLLARS